MINIASSLSDLQIFLLSINIISFLIYAYDKLQSIRKGNNKKVSRISEKLLLTSSFLGGSIGSLLSMLLFRHKIKKLSFLSKFILIVLIQIIIIYFIVPIGKIF